MDNHVFRFVIGLSVSEIRGFQPFADLAGRRHHNEIKNPTRLCLTQVAAMKSVKSFDQHYQSRPTEQVNKDTCFFSLAWLC